MLVGRSGSRAWPNAWTFQTAQRSTECRTSLAGSELAAELPPVPKIAPGVHSGEIPATQERCRVIPSRSRLRSGLFIIPWYMETLSMTLKLNAGLSRKVTDGNYGSRVASIQIELELESSIIGEPGKLQDRIRQLFALVRASLNEELNGNEHALTSQ